MQLETLQLNAEWPTWPAARPAALRAVPVLSCIACCCHNPLTYKCTKTSRQWDHAAGTVLRQGSLHNLQKSEAYFVADSEQSNPDRPCIFADAGEPHNADDCRGPCCRTSAATGRRRRRTPGCSAMPSTSRASGRAWALIAVTQQKPRKALRRRARVRPDLQLVAACIIPQPRAGFHPHLITCQVHTQLWTCHMQLTPDTK